MTGLENRRQTRLKQLMFAFDNGLEFVSSKLEQLYKSKGMTRQYVDRHTWKNEVVEMMNITLLDQMHAL